MAARAQVQLSVGEPDFVFDKLSLDKLQYADVQVGEPFQIYGAWANQGTGNFHNYAEVDIYHSSDRSTIVWAGALAGNASSENRVEGYFVNTRANHGFPEVFTPQQEGQYLFASDLDPEKVSDESNENNNTFDVYVDVGPNNLEPSGDETENIGEVILGTNAADLMDFSGNSSMDNVAAIQGLGGNDTIKGSNQADVIDGGSGNDTLEGNGGDDKLLGGSNNDKLLGGAGNDVLDGGSGTDQYFGGANNDTFIIRNDEAASDSFDGGSNKDTILVDPGSQTVKFNNFSTKSVENFEGSGKTIQGTNAANTIDFSAIGSVTNVAAIQGLGGNDTIKGSNQADVIDGGSGNDTLEGNGGDDKLLGGSNNDKLLGGAGNDVLDGGSGTDQYFGGANNDTFIIRNDEAVSDSFDGGSNKDTILVDPGSQTVKFNNFSTKSVENFEGSGKTIQGTNAANTIDFSAIGSVTNVAAIQGLGGNDTIKGSNQADVIDGGSGNDTLEGNGGDDKLLGGSNNDKLLGGGG